MVKVSITLPNNAQITFESEEPEVIHEIVGMVLRDLPRDLMRSTEVNSSNGHSPASEKGNDVVNGSSVANGTTLIPEEDEAADAGTVGNKAAAPIVLDSDDQPPAPPSAGRSKPAGGGKTPSARKAAQTKGLLLDEAEQAFMEFCRSANPLGDMRRVVAAAEGAARFLNIASVDAEELGRLFNLAGWQHPHSFIQTLRNAARSKFRWLERVPGRSGYYTVTDSGRSTALGV